MSNKQLKIWFDDDVITVDLYPNPVADWLHSRYKHLAHLPLDFGQKNIFFDQQTARAETEQALRQAAGALGISLTDLDLSDQCSLNHLHSVYEQNFLDSAYKEKITNTQDWIAFHDAVHGLEKTTTPGSHLPFVSIDYNTRAGRLEKPFDRSYLKHAQSHVTKGQCFVQWEELGKSPWDYFYNHEPDDIDRLCELAKPWLMLRTSFRIACGSIDLQALADFDQFDQWFESYQQAWCQHWHLTDWTPAEMLQVIPIGEIDAIDRLIAHLQQQHWPIRVTQ